MTARVFLSELRVFWLWLWLPLLLTGCFNNDSLPRTTSGAGKIAEERSSVVDLIDSEDLILDLSPRLSRLAASLKTNNSFRLSFAESKSRVLQSVSDINSVLSPVEDNPGVSIGQLKVTEKRGRIEDPWHSINQFVDKWAFAKFGVKSAKFKDRSRTEFEMKTVFYGRFQSAKQVLGANATQSVVFKKIDGQWQLTNWFQDTFDLTATKTPLFDNVTESVIADKQVRDAVTRSVHEEYIVNVVNTGITPVYDRKYLPFADVEMNHATPSVSVVDLDQDGWDDLFVTARWSRPVFLRNQQDGTFDDLTKEIGISIPGLVNCSCFTDIDNDGDLDLLLGRAMEPILFMENRDGRFHDVTAEKSDLGDLYFVSAISASDINRDGLIDFYLSTYGPAGDNRGVDWKSMFLSSEQRQILNEKERNDHMWVDFPGPPNVIVMNRGDGRLEQVPVDSLVSQWHNSFQSAWADFDSDGDDDLYVCNDFAPGGFLINETATGTDTPTFSDGIPKSFPSGTMGFGMGISWADYDGDADLDLYVSNMYSKAGKRILNQLPNNDPRFVVSATGNYLFENGDGVFKQMAGPAKDQLPVHQVGWSYGGQFADFNNDGKPDIYVPSGFFTAPDTGGSEVDL